MDSTTVIANYDMEISWSKPMQLSINISFYRYSLNTSKDNSHNSKIPVHHKVNTHRWIILLLERRPCIPSCLVLVILKGLCYCIDIKPLTKAFWYYHLVISFDDIIHVFCKVWSILFLLTLPSLIKQELLRSTHTTF